MKTIYTCLIVILLTSCATKVNYLGNTFNPTEKIDVFVDETAIKKSYDIVGKGYVQSNYFTRPEHVQTKAIETARKKGADAVLIKDYYIPVSSTGINTTLRSDSVGKSLITTGKSTISQNVTSEFMVLFLKYN